MDGLVVSSIWWLASLSLASKRQLATTWCGSASNHWRDWKYEREEEEESEERRKKRRREMKRKEEEEEGKCACHVCLLSCASIHTRLPAITICLFWSVLSVCMLSNTMCCISPACMPVSSVCICVSMPSSTTCLCLPLSQRCRLCLPHLLWADQSVDSATYGYIINQCQ